jgi:hypothetical protein
MGLFSITLAEGGLLRQAPSEFMKSGLVCGGVAAAGLVLNAVSDELSRIEDVEALGIDADYDSDNDVLVHYHCKEFFRMNPSGKLRLMLVAQGTTLQDMCDKTENYVQKMVVTAGGDLRRVGVVLNPADGYSATLETGLDADVVAAMTTAKALTEQAFLDKRPIQLLIEGREFNGAVAALLDGRTKLSPYVYVTLLQDPAAVSVLGGLSLKSAAVGTTLGAMSFVQPNESIGWTGKMNLSDATSGEFATVAFSSNALSETLEADYESLTAKGYLFGRTYPNQSGVYFDDYPSLASITSDYAYGQEVAVILDAGRRIYDQLFPRINSPIRIDPDTGFIAPEVAKEIEADGGSALDIMTQSEWISGYDVFVNPEQDVLTTGILEVQFELVAIATGRVLKATIGFTKKIG